VTREGEDMAYRLGLGRVDDEGAVGGVITERHIAPIHIPFFFEAAILSRIRSPVTSRSNWAKDNSTLRVSRPIEFVVLNCWVTATNEAPCASKISTSRAKSASERVSRSTL